MFLSTVAIENPTPKPTPTRRTRWDQASETSNQNTIVAQPTQARTPQDINFHCVHKILSVLSPDLFDLYYTHTSAFNLWNELENKYGQDDVGVKRYSTTTFNSFIFVDDKPMNPQIHEFEGLV